jgi:CheY-like chemotaxis protein
MFGKFALSTQPTILYVEDDALSREIMHVLLTMQLGYQNVFIFDSSTDFIDKVTALPCKPEIILLDIHIGPYDGFQMLRMLRESPEYETSYVVALTASVMNEEIEALRDAGFNGVLSKPIDPDTFLDMWRLIAAHKPIWNLTQ